MKIHYGEPGKGFTASVSPANMRVTDKERDACAEELSRQFGLGTLDQETFDKRLDTAMHATRRGELDLMLADLPAPTPLPRRRAPWTGGALSALVPGLGSAVNGFWQRALVIFVAWFAIILVGGSLNQHNPWVNVLVPLWFGVYVLGIVDGVLSVRRRNARRASNAL